jgi:putative ABC transport system permease protein
LSGVSGWLLRLLVRAVPEELRDSVLGDLDEEAGPGRTEFWRVVEVGRISARFAGARVKDAAMGRLAAVRGSATGGPGRDTWKGTGGGGMDGFARDVRFAVRTLVRRPAFSVTALAILTLGIGGNVTMFAVVEQVLLTPLPFEKPHELVRVYERRPQVGLERNVVAFPDLADWKAQNEVFSEMVGWTGFAANLTGSDEPVRVLGAGTTWEIFEVIGVAPTLGRGFRPEDDVVDAEPVIVLSHALWRQRFGADPDVLGRSVQLDGQSRTVIGVVASGAGYPASAQFWTPLAADPYGYSRGGHFMNVLARLAEGVTLERARADMQALALRLEAEYTDTNEGHYTSVFPLADVEIGDARGRLLFLMAAVGFLLLIVCINLGNMQIARTLGRRTELAVRTAMGAARGRLLSQLVTESAVLAGIGGALGLIAGLWAVRLVDLSSLVEVPWVETPTLDLRVFGFTLFACLGTVILTGLLPALGATRDEPASSLRERRGRAPGMSLRNALVGSEVALTVVLLFGAGVTLRSFALLSAVDPGFEAEGVLTADLNLPISDFPTPSDRGRFADEVLTRLRAVPGVTDAAVTMLIPLAGGDMGRFFTILDRPSPESREDWNARLRVAGAGYFETMRIPIVSGRSFTREDRDDALPVMILNRTMARQYWPDGDPLGARITTAFQGLDTFTVVGVAEDVAHSALDIDPNPEMYLSLSQVPPQELSLVVRTAGNPTALAGAVRQAVREVDPNQPVANMATMEDRVRTALAEPRNLSAAVAVFALFAVLLAMTGVYGVVAYLVRQRTAEIGLRMALGARGKDIIWLVMGQGLAPVLAGVAAGLVVVVALGGIVNTLLYGVTSRDPVTYAIVSMTLLAVCAFAVWVPARRAVKIRPAAALAEE